MPDWADENPYYLLLVSPKRERHVEIDLGERGWQRTYKKWMRAPGWFERFQYENLTKGACVIHTGGKYDSHLLVPRIPA